MMRHAVALGLALLAPAALAWTPCEQKDLTPPHPIQREAPAYPEAARSIGVEGTAEVSFTVLRDGGVGWVRVIRADPRGYFEQAAAVGVRHWRFDPARANGEPVECRMRTRVRFTLVDTVTTGESDGASPLYPQAMLEARIEGYAEVEFDVGPDGNAKNARVIAAMPRGEFERAALAAVGAARAESAPAGVRHETRRYEFRLPDSTLGPVPPTLLGSAPFPMEACLRRLGGRVALEVETDAGGHVTAARVLSAEPKGLFEETALAVARESRLSPAYRDGQPIAASALITLFFDSRKATCPDTRSPDRSAPPAYQPAPRVSRVPRDPYDGPRAR